MDAADWDARYAGTELVWTAEPNRFLVAEVANLRPGRALDLACGEGRNAVWLAQQGWRAVGVDFSPVGIDKARRLAEQRGVADRIEWAVDDATTHVPEPAGFDLVAILYLHLPRAAFARVLDGASRAVAPGGTLLVVGHADTNLTEGHGGPQDPDVLYGPDDLVAALPPTLTVVKAERVERPVPTDAGTRVAIDVLVRASA